MNKSAKIPTLIGVVFLVLGIAGGVLLVNREAIFKIGASGEPEPKDVKITNITDNSFTVNWITDKESTGFVKWGETSKLGQTAQPEDGSSSRMTHSVTIKNLARSRKYFLQINSGGKDFSSAGVPWEAETSATTQVNSARVSGTVLAQDGNPAEDVIVYVDGEGIPLQSTLASSAGNWIATLPAAADPTTTLLNIYVQGGINGIATAQVFLASANPLPPIQLGKTYDFRNIVTSTTGGVPDSFVTLPEGAQNAGQGSQSRFELSTKATPKTSGSLTIESVKDGETIYTEKPEFFGKAPANTSITVQVHSTTAITQTIKTDTAGGWKWSPSLPLEEGSHTLTISWKDAAGVLQTITRSFTVVANAAEPAFESTPSGSTATPIATKTPVATTTATASASASATPIQTPRATATTRPTVAPTSIATDSATLPEAGISLGTVSLVAFGASFVLGGLFLGMSMVKPE